MTLDTNTDLLGDPIPEGPVALFNESVSRLLSRHPRLGRFARFPVLEQSEGVAATNGWRFYAGPKFAGYAPEERDGIAMHEMLHVLLNHPSRGYAELQTWQNTGTAEIEKQRTILNNAADCVVNLLVCDTGETLPDDAMLEAEFVDQGLTEVLNTLRGRWRDKPPPPPWGNDIAGNDPAGGDKPGAAPSGQGNDPGEGETPQTGDGGFTEDESAAILRAITGRAPPIPVHVWLQRRLLRGTTKRNTWERPSRFGPTVPGRKRRKGDTIVFCVDTSGSIDETTQALFRRIAAGIPHAASTTILFCDTMVRAVVEDIRNPDEIPAAWAHCAGGGGTRFDPALEAARDYNPSHVIYLTDAQGHRAAPTLACDTTWIVYGPADVANHYHPWIAGETIVFIDDAGNVSGEEG